MRTTAELRQGFRAFFESKGHTFHPSWPLIPRAEDHSTLLTSAGMQPLMPFFLGREQPPAPLLTTVQKVFRTPDIDEVGLDGYHLTFFEMLGNFSFGQYFKDGAIELAWEFMFDHMKLDLDRIWVSVFAGDAELGLDEDEVAVAAWERTGCRQSGSSGCRAPTTSGRSAAPARAAPTRRCSSTGGRRSAAAAPSASPAASASGSSSSGTSSSWSSSSTPTAR